MKKYNNIIISFVLTLFFPAISFAQVKIINFIENFGLMLTIFPAILLGLCIVYFFWGTAQFILNSADEKYREEGKKRMFWGFIAIFVFVSIWGIIEFLTKAFFA